MINKKIEEITLDDIQLLIDNSVCESKTLEYKRDLNIDNDANKKEFLADISSFANSIGGDIIIGLEEDSQDKIPINICGISYQNEDFLVRKLESFIRDSIQPIILNIQCKVLPLETDNKGVLIIRIPQSIISPHRIEYKNSGKFYTRNSKGKYPMDVNELRLAFNSGIDLSKRIEEFKLNQYYKLISNKSNLLTSNSPILVVHYIPISSFNNALQLFSMSDIKQAIKKSNSTAFGNFALNKINVDGVSINHNQYNEKSLANFNNNGIIEKATSSNIFEKDFELPGIIPKVVINCIFSETLLNSIIRDFNEMKNYYKNLGITPPIIVSYSFLNAVNYTIPNNSLYHVLGKIDKEILCINDLYIDDFNQTTETILKPVFDSIWNACGYEKCPAFDDDGNYVGLR